MMKLNIDGGSNPAAIDGGGLGYGAAVPGSGALDNAGISGTYAGEYMPGDVWGQAPWGNGNSANSMQNSFLGNGLASLIAPTNTDSGVGPAHGGISVFDGGFNIPPSSNGLQGLQFAPSGPALDWGIDTSSPQSAVNSIFANPAQVMSGFGGLKHPVQPVKAV